MTPTESLAVVVMGVMLSVVLGLGLGYARYLRELRQTRRLVRR